MLLARGMDWSRFDAHGKDKAEAFEAFARQLFERWCRREYGGELRDIPIPDGSGGDGGLDAYAVLASGKIVGLQVKWFPDRLGQPQIDQIHDSFQTAIRVRRNLVRCCVALPCALTDDRGRKEKTERARWRDWIARAREIAPNVEVNLWDEAKLEALLGESENEGLHAYWFPGSVFTLNDLKQRFAAARRGWLNLRYEPHLHATGRLEEDLALRLGEPEARTKILRHVKEATGKLEALREDVARLERLSIFLREVPDAEQLRVAALDALDRMLDAGKALAYALCHATPLPEHLEPSEHDEEHLRRLAGVLLDLERDRLHVPTRSIREHLERCVDELGRPIPLLRHAWARWRGARLLGAYVGAPGVGKTYGLAHAVEQQLSRGMPAVILRARDCPLGGWDEILQKALDQPRSRLPEILNAMEATATRADVRRARSPVQNPDGAADVQDPAAQSGANPGHGDGVEPEPVCFLLAIDGLEESGQHRRWAELLGELSVHLERHPRVRAAVTLRTASREAILGRVRVDLFDEIALPTGGEVDTLLRATCGAMHIELPDRRVRWAIREPLSVRLYCELRRRMPAHSAGWGSRPQDVSLTALLGEKLRRIEEELQDKRGWSRRVPLREALTALAEASMGRGAIRRDDAVAAVCAAIPPAQGLSIVDVHWLLEQAKEHALVTEWAVESDDLLPPILHVELAFEPLVDYLIARRACDAARDALARGEASPLPEVLRDRRDALTQAALLLAQKGFSLVRSGLWRDQLPREEIERLELRAIAALDDGAARTYHGWVLERLRASMPSCRRVLAELCVPVARDVTHPFGPRFVHEALLSLLPAKRDQFWSGPRHLPGDGGQPWEGSGDRALEELTLEDDPADGPPLLLAWALTSVDTAWRRRLRAELARWASRDIGELLRWLDLVICTNDPQMVEDVSMVAYGAACLTGADPSLVQLVRWVDEHVLAPDAPHRREDVAVLHAARGIVERARAVGVVVDPAILERAHRFYAPTGETLPMDAEAARAASDHHGVEPVSTRFAWYVVPPAIDPFFRYAASMDLHLWSPERAARLDPRADRILRAHAEQAELPALSPLRFAFGALVAHLRAVGWNEAEFYGDSRDDGPAATVGMDVAIARYHGDARVRGEVSPVCTVAEKYIRAGCRQLQAYLAARAPADVRGVANGPIEPPVDPVRIAQIEPNPASDAALESSREGDPWVFWADDGLVSSIHLDSQDQVDRAVEWVRTAPPPEIEPWLRLPRGAAPRFEREEDEWITLWGEVRARERESQADSTLCIGAGAVAERDAGLLAFHARSVDPQTLGLLCEDGELGCDGVDPGEAMWAPWSEERIGAYEIPTGDRAIELTGTSVEAGYRGLRGIARSCRLPARWLRVLLGLVDAKPVGGGANWCFMDREGRVEAVYSHHSTGQITWQKALVVRRRALERALDAQNQRLVWSVRLLREPAPGIIDHHSKDAPSALRGWLWLAVMGDASVGGLRIDVVRLPGSGGVRGADEPDAASRAAPARCGASEAPIGPGNPELATPLSSDLDDDQAIPYFLWDDPIPVSEVRRRLKSASPPERDRLLGKILREAQDPDVWRFTTPEEVAARFNQLARHLGRRRRFWEFLLKLWHKEGLLEQEPA
ncbi:MULTISPECIES: hypothetical protein [Sorangium]|uniref:Uncharacterized protein n=1 Tax=Sorangium cellulosum TaxID=56 RepID=A0A4P2R2A2_SORCE|nr:MULTISPECIES: hypothetical protein [Sorangium]AUX37015.1 uncharacterized protein SOCE836_092340 [Sorangium cellulosum]WCQ96308.1 hypothetical protein NQZ70_09093 [Sorangium sp. Soce836]